MTHIFSVSLLVTSSAHRGGASGVAVAVAFALSAVQKLASGEVLVVG